MLLLGGGGIVPPSGNPPLNRAQSKPLSEYVRRGLTGFVLVQDFREFFHDIYTHTRQTNIHSTQVDEQASSLPTSATHSTHGSVWD